MSGLAALIGLRESARWANLPVIVLSELGNPFNVEIMAGLDVRIILTKGEATAPEVARWIQEALNT
jgi:hypothetical protein